MTVHEPECVALKRRGAIHVAKLLSGKSQHEQLEYWRERTRRLMSHNKSRHTDKTKLRNCAL